MRDKSEPAIQSQSSQEHKYRGKPDSVFVSWPYLPATSVRRTCRCQACWGVMCLKEGSQAGWLTNWFAGGLLVWKRPSQSVIVVVEPLAQSWAESHWQAVCQHGSVLPASYGSSPERRCVFIVFPAAVRDTRAVGREGGGQGGEYRRLGKVDKVSEWV